MKHLSIKLLSAAVLAFMTWGTADACTNLLVGKNASVDGSTIITYAADSHTLFGDLQYIPAADHAPGSMRQIIDWDSGKPLGAIPEVAHTYAVVGNMNEHQVTIAESTWGGREELWDTTGNSIIDYGSLMYIALQRSKTAREAIKWMTDLVAKYGYASEGESFSIGDPNEIWIMDMIGKGPGEIGAVWVAIRIPDDCIAGHANNPRIWKFDMKDKKNVMYSKDVISFAKKKGLYSGKDADFAFAPVYQKFDAGALRGCDARVWSYFNRFHKGIVLPDRVYFSDDGNAVVTARLYTDGKDVDFRMLKYSVGMDQTDTSFEAHVRENSGMKRPAGWRGLAAESGIGVDPYSEDEMKKQFPEATGIRPVSYEYWVIYLNGTDRTVKVTIEKRVSKILPEGGYETSAWWYPDVTDWFTLAEYVN